VKSFRVLLTRAASKDLDRFPASDRAQIAADLDQLGTSPIGTPPRIKRLKGFGFHIYRLRCGDYRALYRIDDRSVTVLRIIQRKDLDRILRALKRG
jgi:mRNA interferase RelE/StbE